MNKDDPIKFRTCGEDGWGYATRHGFDALAVRGMNILIPWWVIERALKIRETFPKKKARKK